MKVVFHAAIAVLFAGFAHGQAADSSADPAQYFQDICIRHEASAAPVQAALDASGWRRLPPAEADAFFPGILPYDQAVYAAPASDQIFIAISYFGEKTEEAYRKRDAGEVVTSAPVNPDKLFYHYFLSFKTNADEENIGTKDCALFFKGGSISPERLGKLSVEGRSLGSPHYAPPYVRKAGRQYKDEKVLIWSKALPVTINSIREEDPGTGVVTTHVRLTKALKKGDPASSYTLKN
ncbi:hypothetical protein K1X12_08260 [Hyphomonas sp. WL0036]|uniref:hypothetical protein n=1 Tax=Hyphomonas sediminis TaxID=2866160 RepID=UPI001C7E8C05|nr:hypothetical protein [Hyphomonas sediminis]MBY9066890.1 hypothetical protein [Hyphomonas sediminis]